VILPAPVRILRYVSADDIVSPRLVPWTAAGEADWDALYAAQLPRVYNFFRYRVGSTADAEDLTARTFEKAWRSRHRYRRDLAGFATWLLTIARHVAIDHFRSRRAEAPLEAARQIASSARTPEQDASLGQETARLSRLLERLPEREREIVALKYGAEMTNRAIAAATGLSESNVGTIVQRTLQRLRADWDRDRPEERRHG
jgi:RNA polymerase sigma-70 factor, ECF subfamily